MRIQLERIVMAKSHVWTDAGFQLAGITRAFEAPLERVVAFAQLSGLKRNESLSYATSLIRIDNDGIVDLWHGETDSRVRSRDGKPVKLVIEIIPAMPLEQGSYTVEVVIEQLGTVAAHFEVRG
jgi:hypothetical protein